jgi:hypothetical protein
VSPSRKLCTRWRRLRYATLLFPPDTNTISHFRPASITAINFIAGQKAYKAAQQEALRQEKAAVESRLSHEKAALEARSSQVALAEASLERERQRVAEQAQQLKADQDR